MKNPYIPTQQAWLNEVEVYYRSVINGICMESIGWGQSDAIEACEGPVGRRHAIAKRHLARIANRHNLIRANKEIRSFALWSEHYAGLRPVPISEFSAGKWLCQKHDARFSGIDAQRIDLADPENLFKAVYRVVLRQNHLALARYSAHFEATKTQEGWQHFKETAFPVPMSEESAAEAEADWREESRAIMWKTLDLRKRLQMKQWGSMSYRALFLNSEPTVAGWGCQVFKYNTSGLDPQDPRNAYTSYRDFGYMIVVPQEEGHAIITACEPSTRFRVSGIERIHRFMPVLDDPNKPVKASDVVRSGLSKRIWELNEMGIRDTFYLNMSQFEQERVQDWIRGRANGTSHSAISDLPSFF